MQFGNIIVEARVNAGLNQKQLAARIVKEGGEHISAPYLNDIERNRRTPSSDHMIEQFSTVLKIRPEILYYAAGRIPPWAFYYEVKQESVIAAFAAFRRALYDNQGTFDF
jgi:transcriptional regulator with XRE-family HTH domain